VTPVEFTTAVLGFLNFLAVCFIPKVYALFKNVHDLEISTVELKGEIRENELKIEHIAGNYKQGIEFVRETVESLKEDISDLKTEIRELFKKGH